MAKYRTAIGSFQSRTTTGSQAYTGVGFQPKALFIWSVNTALTLPEFNNFNYWSAGMTDGTTHVALTSISFDNQGTTDLSQGVRTDSIILAEATDGATQHRATFTSFDSDGFTLNWTDIFSSEARYYNYLAIGGDEVEVKVGVFNSNTSPGSQSVTSLAFSPSGVIFMPAQNAGTSETSLTYPAIGYTDGVNQGASYVWSEEGAAAANTKRYQRINKCIALGTIGAGAVSSEAGITSLDDTGFTVDWTTAPASAHRIYYLAFSVIPFKVGVITQPAASGSAETAGLGFRPGSVLFQSVNAAASTSVQDGNDFSLGGGSPTQARAVWLADKDAADPVQCSRYYSQSLVYAAGVVAATASALACSASLVSMDYDGFTLSHTADGTQRQILFAAFSSEYSHRNLVSGQGHTVVGHDNVVSGKNNVCVGTKNHVHGENGTVIGHRSALFNLDGTTRTLEGDDKFEVYGEIGGDIGPGASGWVQIEEQTPSGVGTITFSALGSYTHLEVRWSGRSSVVATNETLALRLNGDTGSNYDRELLSSSASTATASESIGGTSGAVGSMSGSTATAGQAGAGTISIYDYRGTTFQKAIVAQSSHRVTEASAGVLVRHWGVGWRNTAAVTSITLFLATGNFEAGSKFSLYGLA